MASRIKNAVDMPINFMNSMYSFVSIAMGIVLGTNTTMI